MAAVIENQDMLKGTTRGDTSVVFIIKASDLVQARSSIIAFQGAPVESMLKSIEIETLVLCGMLSDICVEGPMRVAYSISMAIRYNTTSRHF